MCILAEMNNEVIMQEEGELKQNLMHNVIKITVYRCSKLLILLCYNLNTYYYHANFLNRSSFRVTGIKTHLLP